MTRREKKDEREMDEGTKRKEEKQERMSEFSVSCW